MLKQKGGLSEDSLLLQRVDHERLLCSNGVETRSAKSYCARDELKWMNTSESTETFLNVVGKAFDELFNTKLMTALEDATRKTENVTWKHFQRNGQRKLVKLLFKAWKVLSKNEKLWKILKWFCAFCRKMTKAFNKNKDFASFCWIFSTFRSFLMKSFRLSLAFKIFSNEELQEVSVDWV